MNDDYKYELMANMLELSVFVRVQRIRGRYDEWSEDFNERLREADEVLQHADSRLLYKGKGVKDGVVADSFNKLAEAIAILAFVPGGVTIFGNHYQATFDGDPEDLTSYYSVQPVGRRSAIAPEKSASFGEDAPTADPRVAELKYRHEPVPRRRKVKQGKGFAAKK